MPINSAPNSATEEEATPTPTVAVTASATRSLYICPMHPEVEQDHPGHCPKCGMALERKKATSGPDDGESAELRDMTRYLWIGAVLAFPVFLLAMSHMIPVLGRQPWILSPIVAGAAMSLSSVSVIGNALLLRRMKL